MDAAGPDDLIDAEEAGRLLGVTPERVEVLVDEGLLNPVPPSAVAVRDGSGEVQFRRAEVMAVRELGA